MWNIYDCTSLLASGRWIVSNRYVSICSDVDLITVDKNLKPDTLDGVFYWVDHITV